MPRNPTVALSAETTARQRRIATILGDLRGETVTVTYIKRKNGLPGTSTGPVVEIGGLPGFSNGHVVIDTSATKGRPSSVSLHMVLTVNGKAILT